MDSPLQYSWPSLVAQLVKNPPAVQETWVRSLGWEDPMEKEEVTYSSILGLPWWLRLLDTSPSLHGSRRGQALDQATGKCS